MDAERDLERLRKSAGEARERSVRTRDEIARRSGQPPQPGEVFRIAATEELDVWWLIVERDPERGGYLAVAADANLLAGSADVAVPATELCGAMTLRGDFGVRIDEPVLDSAVRVGVLDAAALDRVRQKRLDIARGSLVGSMFEEETDLDPEYLDWVRTLEQAREALARTREPTVDAPGRILPFLRAGARPPGVYAAAASILLALALGFAGGIAWQKQRPGGGQLQRPVVNLPFTTLVPERHVRGDPQTIALPATAPSFFLILDAVEPFPRYRLEAHREARGEPIWSTDRLTATDGKELTVLLSRSAFPDGEYVLRLEGIREGRATRLTEYALRVESR